MSPLVRRGLRVAYQQAARRDAQLELGGPGHRHERRGAVLGVEQWSEELVTLAQPEEIHRSLPTQGVDGPDGGALLLDSTVASRHAVELVRGVEAEHVRERLPLEDVRVDVDLVSRDVERPLAAVGKANGGGEALRTRRPDEEPRRDVLARQHPVALDPDGDRAGDTSEREQE